jgi:hypothetical protein
MTPNIDNTIQKLCKIGNLLYEMADRSLKNTQKMTNGIKKHTHLAKDHRRNSFKS